MSRPTTSRRICAVIDQDGDGNVLIERRDGPGEWRRITLGRIHLGDVPDLIAALQALVMPVAPVVPAAPANSPASVVAAVQPPSREDAVLWAQRAMRSAHDAGLAERVAAALRVRTEDRASSGSPCPEERFGPRDRR